MNGETVMILQNKNRLIPLLAIVLMCGCSNNSEKFDYLVSFPKQGDFINGKFRVGEKFPTFTANNAEDVPVLVDDSKYGDRFTMVVFWRSEIGFCEYKLPRYLRLFEKYKRQGLGVISINADDTSQASQAIASAPALPWTSLRDAPENDLQGKLNLSAWPSVFLLDHEGRVISYNAYLLSNDLYRNFWLDETCQIHALDLTLERLFRNDSDKQYNSHES